MSVVSPWLKDCRILTIYSTGFCIYTFVDTNKSRANSAILDSSKQCQRRHMWPRHGKENDVIKALRLSNHISLTEIDSLLENIVNE
jgi:hypothetical protein